MAIKTLRVFAEYTSTGFVPMPTAGGIDYGYTLASTFPSTTPSSFQTDDPDIDVTVTAMTDFYVWIRINGTAWNPSYTRNVRVYPDSPDINSVVMNMIIATGPAGTSAYSQIVQTANRLYFNGATTDTVYDSKFAGKTLVNELHWTTAPQLATVATSGAYADLTGKPALATVATSGLYADLSSKPSGTAPLSYNSGTNSFEITQATTTTNGFLTSTDWNTFNNKYTLPTGGTTAQYLNGLGALTTFPTTLDSKRLIMTVRNETGATLTKGTVVYINGVAGNTPLAAKAIASGDSTSAQTLGILDADINNNQSGNAVLVGQVTNLNTESYTEGVQLYLSGTTAGAYTSTKTLAPTHLVYVGIVTRAHQTQGVIEVKIQNGYELDEIHDVQISSPANKDILYRDSATSLWKHASIASVLGYTPYNASNPSNYIALTALSASAPLSYNNTTGAFTISQANGTTNGFLSSTDWTTFNSKQSALTLGNVSESVSNVLMFPDGGTGKTIGNLSIQVIQASASTNGYLSSTDWSTFNNKQNALTLTTTGTSGAATLSGATLNIPNYGSAISGTTNYVTKFTSSSAIGNSQIFDNGTSVGIGTAAPSAKLHTVGTIRINSTSVSNQYMELYTDSGISYYHSQNNSAYYTAFQHIFNTDGVTPTEKMRLTSAGNLGLGTTTPTGASGTTFEIFGGSGQARLAIKNNATGSSSLSGLQFGVDTGGGAFIEQRGANTLQFATNGNGRLFITSAGNVGIGTTTPLTLTNATTLHINGTSSAFLTMGYGGTRYLTMLATSGYTAVSTTGATPLVFETNEVERMRIVANGNIQIGGTNFGTDAKVGISNGNNEAIEINPAISSNTGRILFYNRGTSAYTSSLQVASDFQFQTSGTERMRITSGGNLGVGTTTPSKKISLNEPTGTTLHTIKMSSSTTAVNGYLGMWYGQLRMTVGTTYDTTNGWVADSSASAPAQIYLNSSNGYSFITFDTVASNTSTPIERMRVEAGGNILIGTTSDAGYRLYVNGAIYATGNITANSDLTLKKNLQLIDNPIDKLMSLNGYSYQWKSNDEYQYGVIAQEVEKVMSYAVSTGNDGIKGVSYNQLTPLLIEGFKLHNQKIDLHTSRITQLENKVKYLEAKLA